MLKQSKKSGFTLLELLIVVIIVSILAGVALPRFGKMVKRAKAAEGVNIIGALLTAEFLYYQEKDFFAGAYGDLMVDMDRTNFTYDAPVLSGAGAAQQAVILATGTAAGPGTGVTVTGTIFTTGKRTVVTAGL